jgi:tetratricopeptide (TPR) repeat protein
VVLRLYNLTFSYPLAKAGEIGYIYKSMRPCRAVYLALTLFCAAAAVAAPPRPAASGLNDGRDLCRNNFSAYKERLAKNPDDAQSWQELRVCTDLLRRWNQAAAIANEAVENKSDRPEPHLILGLAHYHAKEYAQAVDEFKEAIRRKDDQAMYYFQLGLAYLHINQPQDAVKAGVRATELDPANAAYHHQLAFSYFSMHDDEKCEAEAKRAIELDKNDVAAYKILGSLYARQGKTELAGQFNEEAIHANGRMAAANPFIADKVVVPPPPAAAPEAGEAVAPSHSSHRFEASTPPSDTEIFLKAQWNKMKSAALRGDVDAAVAFYSAEGETRDTYRQSFERMGTARMQEVFGKLGELTDCDISATSAAATCGCPVNGGSGTVLETKVHFQKNSDHIWRITSF